MIPYLDIFAEISNPQKMIMIPYLVAFTPPPLNPRKPDLIDAVGIIYVFEGFPYYVGSSLMYNRIFLCLKNFLQKLPYQQTNI